MRRDQARGLDRRWSATTTASNASPSTRHDQPSASIRSTRCARRIAAPAGAAQPVPGPAKSSVRAAPRQQQVGGTASGARAASCRTRRKTVALASAAGVFSAATQAARSGRVGSARAARRRARRPCASAAQAKPARCQARAARSSARRCAPASSGAAPSTPSAKASRRRAGAASAGRTRRRRRGEAAGAGTHRPRRRRRRAIRRSVSRVGADADVLAVVEAFAVRADVARAAAGDAAPSRTA